MNSYGVTDEMVESGARAIAFRRDAWMEGDRRIPQPYIDDTRACLTAALAGRVVVPAPAYPFSIDDEVYHKSRREIGVVTAIDNAGMHVDFRKGRSPAIYDANWFRVCGELLVPAVPAQNVGTLAPPTNSGEG